MAISNEARKEFQDSVKSIKDEITKLSSKEKDLSLKARGMSGDDLARAKFELSELMVHVASLQMSINSVSLEMLETKNNDTLNDARKSIYKAIIYLEDLVTGTVDCPYADIEVWMVKIACIDFARRFDMVKKIGLTIDLLVEAFGDNSKWKESFVELRGRHAVVAKNMLDMKLGVKAYYEPSEQYHEEAILYIRMVRSLLDKCAEDYRDRYELASKRIDDLRVGINLLIAARRIAMLMNDSAESENIRKKALSWKNRMESDSHKGVSK